ncbi:hypothetical protein MJ1HA_2079 [Metallosphaera sedula]|nr:hypothetical protein MJ1HA_2079 [Metallosphaera sedula]
MSITHCVVIQESLVRFLTLNTLSKGHKTQLTQTGRKPE